jgi:hypothetical protein
MHKGRVSFVTLSFLLARSPCRLSIALTPEFFSFSFRPGRYDSAERHCKSCAGYLEMNSKSKSQILPLEITKEEHGAITIYHKPSDATAEDKEKSRRLVENSVNKLLGRTVGHENFQIHETESESNSPGAIHARIFESLGMV